MQKEKIKQPQKSVTKRLQKTTSSKVEQKEISNHIPKCYISGKITGLAIEDYTAKFKKAKDEVILPWL